MILLSRSFQKKHEQHPPKMTEKLFFFKKMYQVYKPKKYHQIPPKIAPSRSFRQQNGIQVRVEKVDNHRTSSSCIWWSLMMSPRSWQAPLVLEVHSAQLVGKGNDWQVRGWTCGFDSFPPSVAPARRWLMDSMAMTHSKSIIATGPMQQFLWSSWWEEVPQFSEKNLDFNISWAILRECDPLPLPHILWSLPGEI